MSAMNDTGNSGTESRNRNAIWRALPWAIGSAIVGYGVGWMIAEYEDSVPMLAAFTGWARARSATELVAALAVLAMVMLGLWLLYLSAVGDKRLRGMMRMEADDSPARMRRMLPVAGWGMLNYAVIILVFLVPGLAPVLGIAIVCACFAVGTWLFYRGTAMMDELEQAAQREAIIATFLIIEGLGIGWAVLHHFALAPALEPLALVLALVVLYYVVAVIAGFRRGLGR